MSMNNKKPDAQALKTSPNPGVCQNCSSVLQGHYCHNCGQDSREHSRFLGSVLLDLLDNLLSYDSRVNRTLVPLLIKPGYLSNEYIAGRRVRYINPFRLYLFASVIYFLLLSVSGQFVAVDSSNIAGVSESGSEQVTTDNQVVLPDADNDIQVDLSPQMQDIEVWLTDKIKKLDNVGSEKFSRLVMDSIPPIMLLLLPVLALILKLVFFRSGKNGKVYYVEHFVVVLHSQSFLFILFSLLQFLTIVFSMLEGSQWLVTFASFVAVCWALIYIFLMLRRVYGQSRFITAVKYLVLLFTYAGLALLLTLLALAWNIVKI